MSADETPRARRHRPGARRRDLRVIGGLLADGVLLSLQRERADAELTEVDQERPAFGAVELRHAPLVLGDVQSQP